MKKNSILAKFLLFILIVLSIIFVILGVVNMQPLTEKKERHIVKHFDY